MRLPKNLLSGTNEPPEFYLCQVDKTIIGGLNTIEPSGVFKFNAYSEIAFQVDRLYQHPITGDMNVNPIYDYIEALRLIYVVGFGYFQIQEAPIISDGIREYKDCICYSLEYELTQKYLDLFTINCGTVESIDGVKLYDPNDISRSLIHLVLDKMNYGFYRLPQEEQHKLKGKQWTVGSVDISLQNLRRSFEVDHEAIYDFLMNDMAEAFQMVVVFDTTNRTVNLYDESSAGSETNITIAMDTIAHEVKVECSADNIKTCLYVYGGDDLSVREVNLGFEYITNIDYYNTPEWLGEDLHAAYKRYCELIEIKRDDYSTLVKEWSSIYDKISELNNKIPDYEENYDDDIPTIYAKSELPVASEKNVYMKYRVVEGNETWYYICKAELVDDTTIYKWVVDIDNISSFYTFPIITEDNWGEYVGGVYKVYNSDDSDGVLYYVCEMIEPGSEENYWTPKYGWVIAESGYGINLLKEKEEVYLTIQEVQVSAGFASADIDSIEFKRYDENRKKLVEIQELLRQAKNELEECNVELAKISDKMKVISSSISLENNFTPEQIIILNSFIREDEYTNDNIVVTEYDDDATIMGTKQDLLEAAQKELAKISQPQLSFSMEMANILSIPEFEPVINDFKCGNYVMVEIRPGYVVKTQILEININFHDMSDFSVVFGNLASLYSQTDIHATLMSQAISAGKSVAENEDYWNNGANNANSIINRIESGLIDANTTIKSTENQAISWDSHGFHLRKYSDESRTTYLDDQIWLNNEKIVFTDDNWRTAKMAIGKFVDTNLGETYGIVAPSIVGTLIAGENLVIDSAKPDGSLSSFRVDANGARLYNSTFLMEKSTRKPNGSVSNGQIMIDPSYGIVAGTNIYTTKSDGTIVPAFVDSDGVVQKDGMLPLNSNFFLDINGGNAYFRGYVYAEDGYFSGTLDAAKGTFAGDISSATGTFSGSINVANNFKVDQYGNVTLAGNIDMSGGYINWGDNTLKTTISYLYSASADGDSPHEDMQNTDYYRCDVIDGIQGPWYQFRGKNGTNANVTYGNIKNALNRADNAALTFITEDSIDTVDIYAHNIYGGCFYAGNNTTPYYSQMNNDGFTIWYDNDVKARIYSQGESGNVGIDLGRGTSLDQTGAWAGAGIFRIYKTAESAHMIYTTEHNKQVGFVFNNDGTITIKGTLNEVVSRSSIATFG